MVALRLEREGPHGVEHEGELVCHERFLGSQGGPHEPAMKVGGFLATG